MEDRQQGVDAEHVHSHPVGQYPRAFAESLAMAPAQLRQDRRPHRRAQNRIKPAFARCHEVQPDRRFLNARFRAWVCDENISGHSFAQSLTGPNRREGFVPYSEKAR